MLLVALLAAGMLWADVSWTYRFNGLSSFFRLLCIPLLLYQFSLSDRAHYVLIGFLASCVPLLITFWLTFFSAQLLMMFPRKAKFLGVPVKDYISQSAMFTISIFVLVRLSFDR